MGILFIDKTANYSASAIGHAGLYTSLTNGLQALHELRRSASKAINNSAPGKAGGSISVMPTYSAASLSLSEAGAVNFSSYPASGGLTIAAIVQLKAGGSSTDRVVISDVQSSTTNGSAAINCGSRSVSAVAYSFPAPATPPLSGYTQHSASTPTLAGDDGSYELFFLVLEDGVSLRLRRAKTGSTTTTAVAGTRNFAFSSPNAFSTRQGGAAAYTQSSALFAHWNRVLTPAEMDTFYAEMKEQYARLGLAI